MTEELSIHNAPTSELVRCALEAGVPFRMLDLMRQGGPFDRDMEEARAFAEVLAEKGDCFLFKSAKKGETARLVNGLVRTLAVLAFAPGGVSVFGLHFDAGLPDETGAVHCIAPHWIARHAR